MKRSIRLLLIPLWAAFAILASSPFAGAALAHDGGPRLILLRFQFVPGDTLEVTGANLGTDLTVRLALFSGSTIIDLGEAVCDGHGDFTKYITLPDDLPHADYTLQALDSSVGGVERVVAASTLRISDSPVASTVLEPVSGSTGMPEIPRYVYPLVLAAGCLALSLVSTLSKRGRASG